MTEMSRLSASQLMSVANLDLTQLSPAVHDAFVTFHKDKSYLALPLTLAANTLQPLLPIRTKDTDFSSQRSLNELDAVLSPRTPLYLILRRHDLLVAITFVPFLAREHERTFFLEHRHELIQQLGEGKFAQLLICKEIAEITDTRSWEEREEHEESLNVEVESRDESGAGEKADSQEGGVKDAGYKKNKCRLCDRRMKNGISPEAWGALETLNSPGSTVQIVRHFPSPLLHCKSLTVLDREHRH